MARTRGQTTLPTAQPGDVTIPHLESFACAAEHGSFTAAAATLGVTQAAISQRIQQLERDLRTMLFQRAGGRVYLTPAGHKLYDYAQRILGLHSEARAQLGGVPVAVRGELTLAASSIPGEYVLPGVLALFRKRHPGIHVRAIIGDSADVVAQLRQGRVHLGLLGRKWDEPRIAFRPIAADELVFVTSRRKPLVRHSHVPIKKLLELPIVLREPGSGTRACLEQALAAHGVATSDLDVVLELGSNEAIKEAVIQGVGVAVLSMQAIRRELHGKQLMAFRIQDVPLERNVYVAWDERRALPLAAQLFLNFLQPQSTPASP